MSSEFITDHIRAHLIGLRMPRALEALPTVLSQIEQDQLTALEAIETLLGEEYSTRESRRIKMALQTARLTVLKTLASYDFGFQPSLERSRVMALAELGFIERRQCVHFLGPPGTGKSHLAVALGVEAVRAGKSVCHRSSNNPHLEVRTKSWTPLEIIHVFVHRAHEGCATVHQAR
jgi:DNA replication protein DnaC